MGDGIPVQGGAGAMDGWGWAFIELVEFPRTIRLVCCTDVTDSNLEFLIIQIFFILIGCIFLLDFKENQ